MRFSISCYVLSILCCYFLDLRFKTSLHSYVSLGFSVGKFTLFWSDTLLVVQTNTQEKITLFPHYNFTFHFHCTVLHTNNFTNQVNFAAWNLNFNWKFAWTCTQLDFDLSYYQSLYSVSVLLCVTQIFVRQKFWAPRKTLHIEQKKNKCSKTYHLNVRIEDYSNSVRQ